MDHLYQGHPQKAEEGALDACVGGTPLYQRERVCRVVQSGKNSHVCSADTYVSEHSYQAAFANKARSQRFRLYGQERFHTSPHIVCECLLLLCA